MFQIKISKPKRKEIMHKGAMLDKMLLLAIGGHYGQFDRGGNPYILHPLKVMHYLRSEDEELQCIALGHDLLEDTVVTAESMKAVGMTDRIINGIVALTKVEGEAYEDYKARVKANKDAVKVKMADLRHNSDIRRLKGVTEKDIARMKRYNEFYMELKDVS